MVKIGILTYHRSLNYGAVMQASVLASEIKRRFPNTEVEIIDYMSKRMDRYYKMITLYRGKESVFHIKERLQMYMAFQRGLKELPLSKQKLISDDTEKVYHWLDGRYDIIIVGSDAVWNYHTRGLPNPYFPSGDVKCKYMSYAASCNGLGISDFNEIKASDRDLIKASLQNFSYIGVRDLQTEAFVHSILPQAKVYHNCDPSLLSQNLVHADRSSLIKKLEEKYHYDSKKPTIAFMLSNHNGTIKRELAKRIKEYYGDKYQTVSLYSYNPYADIPYIADLTPQEWSIIFGLFDITISKYYHGTLFSLLNGTPVVTVGAEKSIAGMPNKITDVMERLGILDCYFPTENKSFADWEALLRKVDKCLNRKSQITIDESIAEERTSADSFFEILQKLITEKE